MKRFTTTKALARAIGIVGAVIIVVSGVTFAALQSQQAVLKGNTIQTAVANLQVSSNGTTYSNSLDGYVFSSLIPGGQPSPLNGYPVYLKNGGSTALALKLAISKPISNPDNVDLSKVHVILSPLGAGAPQNITLQDLITSTTSGGVALSQMTRLIASQVTGFTLQISMDSDAVSGPSATISDIDFSFGATAVN